MKRVCCQGQFVDSSARASRPRRSGAAAKSALSVHGPQPACKIVRCQ